MRMSAEEIKSQLETVRASHGEAAYMQAKRDIACMVVLRPHGETWVRTVFPELDLDAVRAEAESKAAQAPAVVGPEQMLGMLQQQVPSATTQAHYNVFHAGYDAFRTCMELCFQGDLEMAAEAETALLESLKMARQLKAVLAQVKELPEELVTPKIRDFAAPATGYGSGETELHTQLCESLVKTTSMAELTAWYNQTVSDRDKITATDLRAQLFRQIRDRRIEFQKAEAN